jgi:hypothetical protein
MHANEQNQLERETSTNRQTKNKIERANKLDGAVWLAVALLKVNVTNVLNFGVFLHDHLGHLLRSAVLRPAKKHTHN